MKQQVYLNGTRINVDPSNNLGTGGQAVVVRHNNLAFKIWRQPDTNAQARLKYYLSRRWFTPPTVLLPINALTDSPHGQTIGFTMKLLPDGFRELATLFNKKLRAINNIETDTVVAIFKHATSVLNANHQQNLIVGDLSGRNVSYIVDPSVTTYWYDTDSYHLPGYPCPVWTLPFVDPLLLLSTPSGSSPQFTAATDWYGLTVSLFWALTFSHPFHGDHPRTPEVTDKAIAGLWLYHKDVIPNPIALHPEVLSDELLQFFWKVFEKQVRQPIDPLLLDQYASHLVQCSSCGVYYSQTRSACPQCTTTSAAPIFTGISFHQLLDTSGPIVFVRYQNQKLFAVSRTKRGYQLNIKPADGPVTRINLPFTRSDLHFDLLSDRCLVISTPGSTALQLWDINVSPPQLLTTTSTMIFAGNQSPAFRATSSSLLRFAGNQFLQGQLERGLLLERALPLQVSRDQTWFWADPQTDLIVGLYRIFDQFQFWLITKKGRFEIDVPQLTLGQSLLDITVKFCPESVLVRRLVRDHNSDFVFTDVFDLRGSILISRREPISALPISTIHGATYSHLTLWLPTDTGLVRQDLQSGKIDQIMRTDKAVNQNSQLIHLGGGKHFLVVDEHQVNYLVLP